MISMWLIIRQFSQRKSTQLIGMLMVCLLPFWFTYHRFAMMDGWLTTFLSLSFWAALMVVKKKSSSAWLWASVSGIFYGLALWTKLPALFFLPIFIVIPFFDHRLGVANSSRISALNSVKRITVFFPYIFAGGLGLIIFAVLMLAPGFGQLFARGQDFSYSIPEVISGKWMETVPNTLRYLGFFGSYLTWPVLLLIVAGLFSNRERKTIGLLLFCSFIFLSPFIILGKVVYPRYLLPAVIFLTVASVLSLESLTDKCRTAVREGKFVWLAIGLLIALLAGQAFSQASYYLTAFSLTPNVTPFVAVDRLQYLEEWSSGHGILQTVQLIRELTKSHTVAVATEGRFGTLPDGLLLYFHDEDVQNLYIEGTGQYPVKSLPDFFTKRAKAFDQSLLVVNSHRMELMIPADRLVVQYCRPNNAPCLQVWDVTDLVKAAPDIQIP